MADFSQLETVNNSGTEAQTTPSAFKLRSTHPWFRRPNQTPETRLPKTPTGAGATFLYVVECCGCLKIGHATNLYLRMSNFRVDNPMPVELHHYEELPKIKARRVEFHTHLVFAERCVNGEWFKADLAEVLRTIDRLRHNAPPTRAEMRAL